MLKQALIAGAIVATALVVPAMQAQAANAGTASPAVSAAPTGQTVNSARCMWRSVQGRRCKFCKSHGNWRPVRCVQRGDRDRGRARGHAHHRGHGHGHFHAHRGHW